MANNKNQHYVPVSYLRNFGTTAGPNTRKRSTNSYLFKQQNFVSNVSIRGQCSSDYFYGKSAELDEVIRMFETRYSTIVREISQGHIPDNFETVLSETSMLQLLRTDGAAKRRLDAISQFGRRSGVADYRNDLPIPKKSREILANLRMFFELKNLLGDLRGVILVNKTNVPFITSDDPVCVLNRLYAQRYNDNTAGLIQSGTVCILPLSPSLLFFAYDKDVYRRIGTARELDVKNQLDVNRLNELQAQTAVNSIYFHDWSMRQHLIEIIGMAKPSRRGNWMIHWTGVEDGIEVTEQGRFQVYRKATEEELKSDLPRLNTISPILPRPSNWPTFLKFKRRPVGYTTGSVAGFVRQSELKRSPTKNLRQVMLPNSIPTHETPQGRELIYQKID